MYFRPEEVKQVGVCISKIVKGAVARRSGRQRKDEGRTAPCRQSHHDMNRA
jgi:hypothetical protein